MLLTKALAWMERAREALPFTPLHRHESFAKMPPGPHRGDLDFRLAPAGQFGHFPHWSLFQVQQADDDPFAFIDDDGQAYLFFGNGTPTIYKLKPDMITLDGPPKRLTPPRFNEAVFVIKRQGRY